MGSGALSEAAARAAYLEKARFEQNLNKVRVSCEVVGALLVWGAGKALSQSKPWGVGNSQRGMWLWGQAMRSAGRRGPRRHRQAFGAV